MTKFQWQLFINFGFAFLVTISASSSPRMSLFIIFCYICYHSFKYYSRLNREDNIVNQMRRSRQQTIGGTASTMRASHDKPKDRETYLTAKAIQSGNIYAGASERNEIVGRLQANETQYILLGTTIVKKWVKVKDGHLIGWVRIDTLAIKDHHQLPVLSGFANED